MSKSQIVTLSSVLALFIVILFGTHYFTPTQYKYPECYFFKTNSIPLMNAINKFKNENPQYKVPAGSDAKMYEHTHDTVYNVDDFLIYFYKKNQLISFRIMQEDYNKCDLFLSSVRNIQDPRGWKEINKNVPEAENDEIKKEFVEDFLDKLGYKYKDEGKGTDLFYGWFE